MGVVTIGAWVKVGKFWKITICIAKATIYKKANLFWEGIALKHLPSGTLEISLSYSFGSFLATKFWGFGLPENAYPLNR